MVLLSRFSTRNGFLCAALSLYIFGLCSVGGAKEVSLTQALELSLSGNSVLKSESFQVELLKTKASVDGTWEDPKISWEQMTAEDSEKSMKWTISQEVPLFGERSSLRDLANLEVEKARVLEKKKKSELIFQTTDAYLALYLAQKQQALINEEIVILDQLLAISRAKYTAGKNSKASHSALQLEHAMLQEKKISIETEVMQAQLLLSTLVNDALGQKWKATDLGDQEVKSDFNEKRIETSYDLILAQYELELAQAEASLAKKSFAPKVELMGSVTDGATMSKATTIGASITLPLWAWSKQYEQVQGGRYNQKRVNLLFDAEKVRVRNQFESLKQKIFAAEKRVNLYGTGVISLVRQSFQSSRAGFASGQGAYSDLLPQLRQLYQSEFDYEKVKVELALLKAELERDFPQRE